MKQYIKTPSDGAHPVSTAKRQTDQQSKINQIFDNWTKSNAPVIREDGWTLVGSGKKRNSCGAPVWVGCLNDAWGVKYHKTCHRPTCSAKTCRWSWIDREANKATRKIEELQRRATFFGSGFRYIIQHSVISIPQGEMERIGFDKVRAKTRRLLRRAGFHGWLQVYHPFRYNKGIGWYFSPHFHIISVGWLFHSSVKKIHAETGYVIKSMGIRKTSGEVFSTIRYVLSHAGVKKTETKTLHTVTWLGTLSYAEMVGFQVPSNPRKCPECNEKLKPIVFIGKELDRPPPDGDFEGVIDSSAWMYANDTSVSKCDEHKGCVFLKEYYADDVL